MKLRFELSRKLPLSVFTRNHPSLVVIVRSSQQVSNGRCIAELDVVGSRSSECVEELARLAGVQSVSLMGTIGPLTRIQVVCQLPDYLALASELEMLPRFPRVVQNGEYTFEVAARRSRLRRLIRELQRISPAVHVRRFATSPMRARLRILTPQQYGLLHDAVTAGYFEVPRGITLTKLARRLERSKSTISRNLALIEKELVEAYVATPG